MALRLIRGTDLKCRPLVINPVTGKPATRKADVDLIRRIERYIETGVYR